MKYIRTKDRETGLAIILESEHYYHNELCYCGAESQADTIEKLCDEFVLHTLDGKEQHFISQGHLEDILSNKNINLKDYLSCREIYGAIWTDKGLIYIAKMNDKGELELLWV